jgi:ParB-like chromosome segregation protein Spo0J
MDKKDIVTYLKVSGERAGRLYPVLLDRHGNVIDGMHRLTADKNWPKITIENIETEEQRLITRLISNVCRRNVPAKEKTEMLEKLGEIYQKEGVKPGNIAQKIAEETGMTCR